MQDYPETISNPNEAQRTILNEGLESLNETLDFVRDFLTKSQGSTFATVVSGVVREYVRSFAQEMLHRGFKVARADNDDCVQITNDMSNAAFNEFMVGSRTPDEQVVFDRTISVDSGVFYDLVRLGWNAALRRIYILAPKATQYGDATATHPQVFVIKVEPSKSAGFPAALLMLDEIANGKHKSAGVMLVERYYHILENGGK